MQAVYVLVGAAIAFAGAYTLQRVNATAAARSRIFVELPPPFQRADDWPINNLAS